MDQIGTPKTQTELELFASIHDAMSTGHDRSCKKLGWWAKEVFPADMGFCIRIFDVEENGTKHDIIVYQYSSTVSSILPIDSLDFSVTSGRIRFLMPSKETYHGSWQRWTSFVSEGRNLEWQTWQESPEVDDGTQPFITLSPRQLCGQKCKMAQPTCGGLSGPSVDTTDEALAWWQQPNPWSHRATESVEEEQYSLDLASMESPPQHLNIACPPWHILNRRRGVFPVTNYEWRIEGELIPETSEFHRKVHVRFSRQNVADIATAGNALSIQAGSLDNALFQYQEREFRTLADHHQYSLSGYRRWLAISWKYFASV